MLATDDAFTAPNPTDDYDAALSGGEIVSQQVAIVGPEALATFLERRV